MKMSVLLSMAITPLAFTVSAHAQSDSFAKVSENLGSCLSQASHPAAVDRCHAVHACIVNNSTTQDVFDECISEAEANYQAAMGEAYRGPSPYQPSPVPQQIPLTSVSVGTDISDSRYEERDNAPGFTNH